MIKDVISNKNEYDVQECTKIDKILAMYYKKDRVVMTETAR